MRLRQVRGAGAELDGFRLGDQRRQENETVGDVLGLVGEVLADEGVVEAELVGEDDGFAVLLQCFERIALDRVQGHGEVTETHDGFLVSQMPVSARAFAHPYQPLY